MSDEAKQFTEMVRERFNDLQHAVYTLYCQKCGEETLHRVKDVGNEEVYTCINCFVEKRYTVR